jgi:hypothetical protein
MSFLWNWREPVSGARYAAAGFGLMALKYAVEAAATFVHAGTWPSPLAFLAPFASIRLQGWESAPPEWGWIYGLWTLPFVWVGASLTVRRCRDAALPGWLGLLFFAPILNYLLMFTLCLAPSRSAPEAGARGPASGVMAALAGVVAGGALAVLMVVASVFVLGEYGMTLFVGTPFVMGAVAGGLYNRGGPRPWPGNIGLALATVAVCAGLLLLFALEGLICVGMAVPLAVPLALLGVVLGRGLVAGAPIAAACLGLPFVGVVEPAPAPEVREVVTAVDVAAAPDVVWDAVLTLGGVELDPPEEWYFKAGIAHPVGATIAGEGPGAIRRCAFSTGAFVEPITTWDAPRLLAFDVAENPPTMRELSPWSKVFAPHLDGVLKSRYGSFRLEPRGDGGTRLVGTTGYTFEMAPALYWNAWSDAMIHAIHRRVLEHVRRVAERGASAAGSGP